MKNNITQIKSYILNNEEQLYILKDYLKFVNYTDSKYKVNIAFIDSYDIKINYSFKNKSLYISNYELSLYNISDIVNAKCKLLLKDLSIEVFNHLNRFYTNKIYILTPDCIPEQSYITIMENNNNYELKSLLYIYET